MMPPYLDNKKCYSLTCYVTIILWSSLLTGCCSLAVGTSRSVHSSAPPNVLRSRYLRYNYANDPDYDKIRHAHSSGVTVSHFVTSNVLGERNLPPNPASSVDYDSLLEIVNGDFGVKSAVVKSATEEPVYKGSETQILPLYIPKGAIPIKLARIPRSGSSTSDSLRLPIRRSRVQSQSSITSRRQGGPRRPGPQPPSAHTFLRGWGQRITPKAEARLGEEATDVKASASTQTHTLKIPNARRIASNFSSRTTEAPHTLQRNNVSTRSTASTTVETTTTSKPPISTLEPSAITSNKAIRNSLLFRNSSSTVTEETDSNGTANNVPVSETTNEGDASTKTKSSTEIIEGLPKKLPVAIRSNSRLSFNYNRHTSEGSSVRPLRAGSQDASVPQNNTNEQDTVAMRNLSVQRSRPSLLRGSAPDKTSETSNNQSTTTQAPENNRIKFPTRPTTPRTVDVQDKVEDAPKVSVNHEPKANVMFRMPSIALKTSNRKSSTESSSEINSSPVVETIKPATSTQSPQLSVSIPVRRRRPLRPRVPFPTSSTGSLTVPGSPDGPKTQPTSTTIKPTTTTSTTTTEATTTTTSTTENIIHRSAKNITTDTPLLSLSSSSTTPSNVRRIHEFFKIPSNREIAEVTSEKPVETKAPRITIHRSRTTAHTTPSSVVNPTTHFWRKSGTRKDPLSNRPIKRTNNSPEPANSKSAAEIVLASLAEVMRDVSSDDMDKIKQIAADLDTLNKKLSQKGILIIHAEVDGMIINLRNQTTVKKKQTLKQYRDHVGQRENDSLLENERESIQSQSLSMNDDPSTTIYTPSDKLAYDVLRRGAQENKEGGQHHYLSSLEAVNEVSTTKMSGKEGINLTTSKPHLKLDRTQPSPSSSYFLHSLETTTEQYDRDNFNTADEKAEKEDVVPVDKIIIKVTPTLPTIVSTKSRTTAIPITESTTKYSLEIDFISSNSNTDDRESEGDMTDRPVQNSTIGKVAADIILDESTHVSVVNVSSSEEEYDTVDSAYIEDSNSAGGSSVYLVGMVGIFPLAGVAAYVVRKYLRGESHKKALPDSEERPDGFTPPIHHHTRSHSILPPPLPSDHPPKGSTPPQSTSPDVSNSPCSPSKLLTTSPWEFSRSKLRLVSILGEGNFGVVWKAEARGFCDYSAGSSTVLVAVKKVKDNAGPKEKCDLLRELSVMQLLGPHPNVVSLLGCCTQSEPHLVIMEYVMFGKLLTFLRDHRTRHNYFNFSSDTAALTSRDLTKFACQIASGCEYLQSKGIIHRDLAARNILVDHNKVCKIADFGMARSIQDIGSDIYEQKSKGALPIRWMAPESLYMNIFTHKSDVWSFGILCWEIVTLGSTPYPGLTAREVMRQVTEGYRLERPDHCGPELYRLLASCWLQDLNKRPTFHQLRIELSTLMEHHTGYIDLENFPEDDYFLMHQNNDEKL